MKSTLRENYRYIVVKIISRSPLMKEDIISILRNELLEIVGKIDYSYIMPKIVYFDSYKQAVIIRVLNEGTEYFKSGLSMLTSYKNEDIHLMSIYTAGTIKKAKEKLSSI